MAKNPLDGLDKVIAKAAGSLFSPATLSRTVGEGNAGAPYDPQPTSGSLKKYTCQAFRSEWSSYDLANELVREGEVQILILAATLATQPQPMDLITLKGVTYSIPTGGGGRPPVTTDPAQAVWVCRGQQ